MKKKHRDITVGDKTYGWMIVGGGYVNDHKKLLQIWYNKKIVHTEVCSPDQITPSYVRGIIEFWEL